ncbi:hypothetical protein HLB44_30765 [Aquincola sp. S2]|uniref:Uncharacterized protein n=1 Tax=Pseudaquabacterium terrae TaxID=2732868 RepID=A0ABX2ERW8_9BURK|nr:hypothetical protein [Aquabacterium terrae]NRF71376.1 hypothetical protein [Aquabacterium terrae]
MNAVAKELGTLQLNFASAKFLPFLPEECQENPGVYGFELALWVAQRLIEAGIASGYPFGEDWGWFVECIDDQAEIRIGCSSVSNEGDGYTGEAITWRIFIKQLVSLMQRLKGTPTSPSVKTIARTLQVALEAEGIAVTFEEIEQ